MEIDEVLIKFEEEISRLLENEDDLKVREALDQIERNLYSVKSVILINNKELDKAEELLLEGVEKHSQDFDINYNLAYLYQLTGRFDEAIKVYTKVKTFSTDLDIITGIDEQILGIEKEHRNEPLVSVCMPIYNDEKHISKAIDSVLKQTYQNFEIIVCDNCSTDKTYEIVDKIEDSRIRLYKNEENIGFLLNTNRTWQKAKGKYIVTLHGDDAYLDSYIENVVKIFNNNNKVGIIHFMQDELRKNYFDNLSYFKSVKYYSKIFGCAITPPPTQTAFRREALLKTNYYESDYWTAEVRLMMKIASEGYDAYIEGQYLFERYNGSEKDSSQIDKFILRFEHLNQLYTDYKRDKKIKHCDFELYLKKLTDSFILLFQNKDKHADIERTFKQNKELIMSDNELSRVIIDHVFK
ncbi:glycosyltransferase [Acetobacterium wieringae]|uniref:UDP-Glc:alpha-D-GlcNAc-diphosphoundecaprenol beta-1,3-glucosyltransferase WfgD n=1 Tax=Acetobacterium wieringae TaxID=52694 RepID=A0A1F2PH22_9FIRM|nr:glycosyltransferase [Acetobacterium wieringae]OFV70021.1 UDP-Glc:alpha-D-GlcNAc-diphosphoundecaprenol beta-1,3-glucosyltransferase WfgD [Acetobacterium wieringae]